MAFCVKPWPNWPITKSASSEGAGGSRTRRRSRTLCVLGQRGKAGSATRPGSLQRLSREAANPDPIGGSIGLRTCGRSSQAGRAGGSEASPIVLRVGCAERRTSRKPRSSCRGHATARQSVPRRHHLAGCSREGPRGAESACPATRRFILMAPLSCRRIISASAKLRSDQGSICPLRPRAL